MAFNIAEIGGEIASRGILRSNKFEVITSVPKGLFNQEGSFGMGSRLRLYCETASIPGVTLATAPVMRYGYGAMEKKPIAPVFNDAVLVFRADGNADVWKFLQSWVRLVCNTQGEPTIDTPSNGGTYPYELAYKEDYVSDVQIITYNDAGEVALTTYLRQAYPFKMDDLPLNWERNMSVLKIPTAWTFLDYYQQAS